MDNDHNLKAHYKVTIVIAFLICAFGTSNAQVPFICKKNDSPDTVLIYNTYSTVISLSPTGNKDRPYDTVTARGPFNAATGYDTISWNSELRYAANDCQVIGVEVFRVVVAPSFRGTYQYIKQHFHYPEDAKAKNIHGFSVVEFRLDSNGKVSHAHIHRPISPSIDAEAVKLVANMPNWEPAKRTANYIYRILLKF